MYALACRNNPHPITDYIVSTSAHLILQDPIDIAVASGYRTYSALYEEATGQHIHRRAADSYLLVTREGQPVGAPFPSFEELVTNTIETLLTFYSNPTNDNQTELG